MKNKIQFQYFKIKKDRQEYKGERYFKFSYECQSVTQIVIHTGEEKKGKNNTIGVYLINKMTFISNYMHFYVEPSTKKEFEKNFGTIKM